MKSVVGRSSLVVGKTGLAVACDVALFCDIGLITDALGQRRTTNDQRRS